jgi:exopolyphosphatase/guanosine-5'-triphosphate,3'-diphosphate pyrophosphatase
MSSPRYAFIDIGTNTILCLIAEIRDGGRFRVLADLAEIARLGKSVDRTGLISSDGEQRAQAVLRRYLDVCRNLGVAEIVAVGTSALRDARNSAEIGARWRQQLGLNVRVINGDQEAAYSSLAIQRGLPLTAKELLVVDIGGGSSEFIRCSSASMSETLSVDLGSVRLTERFLRTDPVSSDEFKAMVVAVDQALKTLPHQWMQGAPDLTLVGIAGTFTTMAAVEKKLVSYSHSEVHGSELSIDEVRRQVRLFQERTLEERKRVPGLEPERADVILAGACLVERIMILFDFRQVIVSDQGVRYGLLYERLGAQLSC